MADQEWYHYLLSRTFPEVYHYQGAEKRGEARLQTRGASAVSYDQ